MIEASYTVMPEKVLGRYRHVYIITEGGVNTEPVFHTSSFLFIIMQELFHVHCIPFPLYTNLQTQQELHVATCIITTLHYSTDSSIRTEQRGISTERFVRCFIQLQSKQAGHQSGFQAMRFVWSGMAGSPSANYVCVCIYMCLLAYRWSDQKSGTQQAPGKTQFVSQYNS